MAKNRITALVVSALAALLAAGWLVSVQLAEAAANRTGAGAPRGMQKIPEGRRGGDVLEIRLDDIVRVNLSNASVVIDRDAATDLVQGLLGTQEPLESILLVDLLEVAPRIRVSWRSLSAELGEQMMIFLARRVVGRDVPVRDIRVGDLLEALPDVRMDASGSPTIAGGEDLARELSQALGRAERFQRARDVRRIEGQDLELRYARLSALLDTIGREGPSDAGPEAIYEEAFARLFDTGQEDLVPVLEGRRRLDREMAEADYSGMTLAGRIAFRSEARRRAFGEEAASKLFARREAIERYQVDLIALEGDPSLGEAEREARIEARREALKVEMAAWGSFVGFVGEGREEVDAILRDRLGEKFDRLSEAQLREARRGVRLERLPPDLREEVESRRSAPPGKARAGDRGRP